MIQLLRGTKSQLDSYQTVIAEGQPIFEKDTGQLKIGNGSSIYSALPYVGTVASQSSEIVYDLNRDSGYLDLSSHIRFHIGVTTVRGTASASPFDTWTSDYQGYGLENGVSYRVSPSDIPNSHPYLFAGAATPTQGVGVTSWVHRCQPYGYSSDRYGYIIFNLVSNQIDNWNGTRPSREVSYWAITTDIGPQS